MYAPTFSFEAGQCREQGHLTVFTSLKLRCLPTVLVLKRRIALPRLAGLHHQQASDSLPEISPSGKAQVGQPGPKLSFRNDSKSDYPMQRNHEGHRSRFDISNLGSPSTSGHRPSALHSIFNYPFPRRAMQHLRLRPEDTEA